MTRGTKLPLLLQVTAFAFGYAFTYACLRYMVVALVANQLVYDCMTSSLATLFCTLLTLEYQRMEICPIGATLSIRGWLTGVLLLSFGASLSELMTHSRLAVFGFIPFFAALMFCFFRPLAVFAAELLQMPDEPAEPNAESAQEEAQEAGSKEAHLADGDSEVEGEAAADRPMAAAVEGGEVVPEEAGTGPDSPRNTPALSAQADMPADSLCGGVEPKAAELGQLKQGGGADSGPPQGLTSAVLAAEAEPAPSLADPPKPAPQPAKQGQDSAEAAQEQAHEAAAEPDAPTEQPEPAPQQADEPRQEVEEDPAAQERALQAREQERFEKYLRMFFKLPSRGEPHLCFMNVLAAGQLVGWAVRAVDTPAIRAATLQVGSPCGLLLLAVLGLLLGVLAISFCRALDGFVNAVMQPMYFGVGLVPMPVHLLRVLGVYCLTVLGRRRGRHFL